MRNFPRNVCAQNCKRLVKDAKTVWFLRMQYYEKCRRSCFFHELQSVCGVQCRTTQSKTLSQYCNRNSVTGIRTLYHSNENTLSQWQWRNTEQTLCFVQAMEHMYSGTMEHIMYSGTMEHSGTMEYIMYSGTYVSCLLRASLTISQWM